MGRVYLINYVHQFVHILPEGFGGGLECMNVSEQILQGIHGLKRERGGENTKLGVAGGEEK